jgi:hypothetical protein
VEAPATSWSTAGWVDLLAAAPLQAVNLLASVRNGTGPLALPARLLAIAVGRGFLLGGLLLALIATLRLDASAPSLA